LALPNRPPRSANEALAALAESAQAQVRAMSATERAELFSQLAADKVGELPYAGLIFLPAAKETLLDTQADAVARANARRFLSAWAVKALRTTRRAGNAATVRWGISRVVTTGWRRIVTTRLAQVLAWGRLGACRMRCRTLISTPLGRELNGPMLRQLHVDCNCSRNRRGYFPTPDADNAFADPVGLPTAARVLRERR